MVGKNNEAFPKHKMILVDQVGPQLGLAIVIRTCRAVRPPTQPTNNLSSVYHTQPPQKSVQVGEPEM
jgi:hypothetical protein